jgi:NTE family protein
MNTVDNQGRRTGAYWSIRGSIDHYPVEDKLPCPSDRTWQLANIETDLAAKDVTTQRRLINWGYAMCDAGIRSWVEDDLPPPEDFPFPAEKV